MTIDYVTWKIIPKLDYPNKEGIFITVDFCEFSLYLTPVYWWLDLVLVLLHSSKLHS